MGRPLSSFGGLMPDQRFFQALGPLSLSEIAAGSLAHIHRGDPALRLRAVAPLAKAGQGEIAYLGDARYAAELATTQASAVFVTQDKIDQAPADCAVLVTREPQAAYARAANLLHHPLRHQDDQGAVHASAELEEGVTLSPGVVIGQNVRIGAGTEIGANSVIGPGVSIGRGCRIGSNVTVGFALVGDRVRILSGAVIGEEGFGVAGSASGAIDVPQLGRVIIQDGVTIGANACIDRGAYDDTVIGENTKIDNLVQVGHNNQIGRNCVIAAHSGLSGSCVLGDGVMFGGAVGVSDHMHIGAGARVAARSGVMHTIPPGETWCGTPAKPIRRFMREVAWLARQIDKKPS